MDQNKDGLTMYSGRDPTTISSFEPMIAPPIAHMTIHMKASGSRPSRPASRVSQHREERYAAASRTPKVRSVKNGVVSSRGYTGPHLQSSRIVQRSLTAPSKPVRRFERFRGNRKANR